MKIIKYFLLITGMLIGNKLSAQTSYYAGELAGANTSGGEEYANALTL